MTSFSVPRSKDHVTSGPAGCPAIFEEDLHVGLHFSLHPLIRDALQHYDIVFTQLGLNSFHVLAAFVILCHLTHVQPRLELFRPFFILNKFFRTKG